MLIKSKTLKSKETEKEVEKKVDPNYDFYRKNFYEKKKKTYFFLGEKKNVK